MWVCGLKRLRRQECYTRKDVTPYVGVWIETNQKEWMALGWESHPMWVCGLKHQGRNKGLERRRVTPYVGVWIETVLPWQIKCCVESHTLCGCVDWNFFCKVLQDETKSHTLCGCVDWNNVVQSKPRKARMSHPMWVCGLKHWNNLWKTETLSVTPYVGVWIETLTHIKPIRTALSHTLCGCVDWNKNGGTYAANPQSHTLCGCVDWNNSIDNSLGWIASHTLCGCVDWNTWARATRGWNKRHTLCGCVDWNMQRTHWIWCRSVSHPMWVCGLKPNYALRINHPYKVTPYVGVWIETFGFRTN